MPQGSEPAGKTEEEPKDTRPRKPDTVEDWKSVAIEEDTVLMLGAENGAVFVAWIEDSNWKDADGTWISNNTNEAGNRQDGYPTENLVDRWFREAVPDSCVWKLEYDEVPLDVERYLEMAGE